MFRLAMFVLVCLLTPPLAADERPIDTAQGRPNIILVMADDMGYSDIGCYGGEIRTPNLDQLASQGLRFTQFYNTGRCCPTRASLLTGLYPHQAGVGHMTEDRGHDGYRGDLNDRCITIAQALKTGGYSTYMAGKWHVTKHVGHWSGEKDLTSKHNWPRQRGFDRFFGTITGAGSYYNPVTLVRDNEPVNAPEGFYYTDAINDTAARFIREHKSENPFFMYVANVAPHWPLHAREEDVARYKGRYTEGWDALREQRYKRMIEMGLIDSNWPLSNDPKARSWNDAPNKPWHERRMEVYAAQVEVMDRGIARIIEALQDTGRYDNTLILFLADNGGCAEEITSGWKGIIFPKTTRDGQPTLIGNNPQVLPGPEPVHQSYGQQWAITSDTPFRYFKHYVHEGGIASPLIAHWPNGIAARGQLQTQPAHLIDIMATCLDLSGTKYPAQWNDKPLTPPQGVSLLPAFDNKPLSRPQPIFWEHEGNRAIREGKWKLVAAGTKGDWELYDMEADRTEMRNLAGAHPDIVKKLSDRWEQWAVEARAKPWPYQRK